MSVQLSVLSKPLRYGFGVVLLVLLLLGAGARNADAQEHNFRPYIVGERAAGMGGAFTALANDGSGPYYNPAGIAFAAKNSLSLSASVYGVVRGTLKNALGPGQDFRFSDINTFPVSASAVFKLGGVEGADVPAPHALGLSLFIPDAILIDDRTTLGGQQQNSLFLSTEVQTIWAGATYAYRRGRLGVGASGFLLIGTAKDFVDITFIVTQRDFVGLTVRGDETVYGFVGSAGMRIDVTDHLRVGLSVYSPAVGGGDRKIFARGICVSQTPTLDCAGIGVLSQQDLGAGPSQPLRLQLGSAWESKGGTLSADVILLAPRTLSFNAGERISGIDISRTIERKTVVNFSVGAEKIVGGSFPLRVGFFTDFSAAPDLTLTPGPGRESQPNQVSRYGGTFSVGYKGDHSSINLGGMISYGQGTAVRTADQTMTLERIDVSHLLAYMFLASSYEF